jgi:hypothetical protein
LAGGRARYASRPALSFALGITINEVPVTPERVATLIDAARAGQRR